MRYGHAKRDRDSATMIPEGVSILYEDSEIEALLHLFDFLDEWKAAHAEAQSFPALTMSDGNGKHARVEQEAILAKINSPQFSEESFTVGVFFFDEMRPLFIAYFTVISEQYAEIEQAIKDGDTEYDDGNPIQYLYLAFSEIKRRYFPERSEMH